MASSGSGKVSSQFFVCLTDDPSQLNKLTGKYVAFGQLASDCFPTLQALEAIGADSKTETPLQPIWVHHCSIMS